MAEDEQQPGPRLPPRRPGSTSSPDPIALLAAKARPRVRRPGEDTTPAPAPPPSVPAPIESPIPGPAPDQPVVERVEMPVEPVPRPVGARPVQIHRATGIVRPSPAEIRRNRLIVGGVLLGVLALVVGFCTSGSGSNDVASTSETTAPVTSPDGSTVPTTGSGLAEPVEFDGWVDPASSGEPWSSDVVGQITFRGNPTRSYYGVGPVPTAPEVQWVTPPEGGLCSNSPVGGENKTWCGSGWTGQPSVWAEDDVTWVSVGAYDANIHFWNAATGDDVVAPYDMGDIIKGSVTRDPDGFPLLYTGSRNNFEILALDRDDGEAESLWTLGADAVAPTKWNDDWDSSPLVIDDYLFEGGENGQFHIVKLNRAMDENDKVTVAPEIVFNAPGWDDELLNDLAGSGSRVNDVSIENSLAISGNTVYFSNSGGLVQGWDITNLKEDPASVERSFRFWTGDDTDASVVIDKEGMLYVAQEVERESSATRNAEVGQLVKLDPTKPEDPIVWSVADPRGMWATPAISDGVVVAPTDSGNILGVDQETGEVLWEKDLPGPTWSSPVIVDGVWVQGDCSGVLHGFDFSDPRVDPPELWTVELEGCVESTPTVFQGQIFVGARGGKFYALGDA